MKISLVIPVKNLWKEYTQPCLTSILNSRIPSEMNFDILIIDNGSTDETKDAINFIAQKQLPMIKYYRNEENLGCSRTWNFGIRRSIKNGSDLVFIINNDILLHQNCIAHLYNRLKDSADNVVMATAMDIRGECIIPEDVLSKRDLDKEGLGESDSPNFAAFMLNKKLIENVGEFDEGFFPAYFEDNDMHYRIKLAGVRAICKPMALFYHFVSRTQLQVPGGLIDSNQFSANRDYYVSKWGGVPGSERFTTPFNDPNLSIKWTKQSSQ